MDFRRQLGIFNPSEHRNIAVSLIGCGSVGSFTALALAKMGVPILEAWDMDIIEEHNLPNQFFKNDQIGMKKTEALCKVLSEFSEAIVTPREMVSIDSELCGSVIVSAVDSIEARKVIWEAVKKSDAMLYIDSRMGGRIFSVFTVNLDNKKSIKAYEKRLFAAGAPLNVPCTERTIIFNVLGVASVVCNQVTRYAADEETIPEMHFDYTTYICATIGL